MFLSKIVNYPHVSQSLLVSNLTPERCSGHSVGILSPDISCISYIRITENNCNIADAV